MNWTEEDTQNPLLVASSLLRSLDWIPLFLSSSTAVLRFLTVALSCKKEEGRKQEEGGEEVDTRLGLVASGRKETVEEPGQHSYLFSLLSSLKLFFRTVLYFFVPRMTWEYMNIMSPTVMLIKDKKFRTRNFIRFIWREMKGDLRSRVEIMKETKREKSFFQRNRTE